MSEESSIQSGAFESPAAASHHGRASRSFLILPLRRASPSIFACEARKRWDKFCLGHFEREDRDRVARQARRSRRCS